MRSVEALLIDSVNDKLPENMVKMYERDVDMQKLKLQFKMQICVLRWNSNQKSYPNSIYL